MIGIGGVLESGEKHDGRSPDYDDWELNGDLLFYNPVLDDVIELSSMGIRVDEEALSRQLEIAGAEDRKSFDYHRELLNGDLPYTIGVNWGYILTIYLSALLNTSYIFSTIQTSFSYVLSSFLIWYSQSHWSTYKECRLSSSSSFLIAFISAYIPSYTGILYLFIAILFHFAKDWTISAFLFINGTTKLTGVSTPLKLSLLPVSGRTKRGEETLKRLNSLLSSD